MGARTRFGLAVAPQPPFTTIRRPLQLARRPRMSPTDVPALLHATPPDLVAAHVLFGTPTPVSAQISSIADAQVRHINLSLGQAAFPPQETPFTCSAPTTILNDLKEAA